MSPKPNVSEMRTKQIIEAAIAVFAKKGFARATMEDVANEVSINKATIYNYFDGKDALILAVAGEILSRELGDLQAACDMPGTATERLNAFYETLTVKEADVLFLMPILYEFYALGLRRDDVRTILADFLSQSVSRLEAIIQAGVEDGEFGPVDARKAAQALTALIDGIVLQWIYTSEKVDINVQLRYSIQFVLQGLVNYKEEAA